MSRRWVYRGPPNYPFVLNRASWQARGLMAWWPMLGSRGATALHDFAGNIDGVADVAINAQDPIVGTVFLSTDPNEISLGASSQFTPVTNELTVSGWAYAETGGDNNSTLFVFQGGTNNSRLRVVRFGNDATVRVWYRNSIDGLSPLDSGNILSTTKINHICLTIKDADLRLFANGVQVASTANIDATHTFNFLAANAYIGQWTSGRGWVGPIGEFRLYNRVLTPIEVYQLYAPQTRWELYQPVQRDALAFVAAAGVGPVYPGRNHPSRNVSLRL